MTFSTYADLKSNVALWLARDDLTANIPDFITLFEAVAARKLRVRPMETLVTLTPSGGSVALPSDFLASRRVTWTGSTRQELEYVHPSYLQGAYPVAGTGGIPAVYSIEAGNIKVRPVDDTPLEVVYFQRTAALSNALNWLYTNYPDIYLFGALTEAHLFVKDPQNASLWMQRRDTAFEEIRLVNFRENSNLVIKVMQGPIGSQGSTGSSGGTTPTNNAPTLDNPISDQGAFVGTPFSFQVPSNSFSDPNGDTLTYTATLTNGNPLPTWLVFTAGTRTFAGTPALGDVALISIRVTATDPGSLSAYDDQLNTQAAAGAVSDDDWAGWAAAA